MFFYIRWFSGISFVVVVLAAILVGNYFKERASQDFLTVISKNNSALAKVFINTTWKTYRDREREGESLYKKFKSSGINPDQWSKYKGYQEMVDAFNDFNRGVFKYFEDIDIAQVNIYNPDGTSIISIDRSNIEQGTSGLMSSNALNINPSDSEFAKARSGNISSVVLENQSIRGPDGTEKPNGVIVKTLYPIIQNNNSVNVLVKLKDDKSGENSEEKLINCPDEKEYNSNNPSLNCVEAIIEIKYQATEQWNGLDKFRQIGAGGVIIIFLVIISTLLFTSLHAESIITKQHEINIELAAQTASAQAENRDKSQFLANVSHELRTPLNAIIGFSEFIKLERSGPMGNAKYAEYIRDIHSSGVHLLSLINDILDYSKAEADKLELEVSEIDATKSVRNSMRLVSPRAESAQVTLVEEIPREHFIIKTDSKKLKQIMLNLLSNAVKFTPSGGAVTVTMWQNVVDGALSIEVKDTGIGIAPKDISRAMAPFGQVDNSLSRKYEGTGLGLPLTRKFVEIMGGTFSIQSEVGKGTTITVTIPKEVEGKVGPVET